MISFKFFFFSFLWLLLIRDFWWESGKRNLFAFNNCPEVEKETWFRWNMFAQCASVYQTNFGTSKTRHLLQSFKLKLFMHQLNLLPLKSRFEPLAINERFLWFYAKILYKFRYKGKVEVKIRTFYVIFEWPQSKILDGWSTQSLDVLYEWFLRFYVEKPYKFRYKGKLKDEIRKFRAAVSLNGRQHGRVKIHYCIFQLNLPHKPLEEAPFTGKLHFPVRAKTNFISHRKTLY